MVLIGIRPFGSKKVLILILALICLSSAICFGDSIFMSIHSKSQGRHLNRNKPTNSVTEFVADYSLVGIPRQNLEWNLRNGCVFAPVID